MKTIKQENVAILAAHLAVLGLVGHDTDRLARRVVEGSNGRSNEDYANVLHNACRETVSSEQNFLVRFTGMDCVIYGPKGYCVVDHHAGWIDVAYTYRNGKSFDSLTKLYREEQLDLRDTFAA
jgi:hypothetical protein